jgi:carbon monoxide dehydrogenase subunit G
LTRSATKAKKLKAVANPKKVIQDLCGLISVTHRSPEFDLSSVIQRQMDLVRKVIVTNGIDFANEVAAPFDVTFRAEGSIASANGYKMAFTDVRDISGHLE